MDIISVLAVGTLPKKDYLIFGQKVTVSIL